MSSSSVFRFTPFCAAALLFAGSAWTTSAQASYPLFCTGPYTAHAPGIIHFEWAPVRAGDAKPAPGHCAWADRTPRGDELTSHVISDIPMPFSVGNETLRICVQAVQVMPYHFQWVQNQGPVSTITPQDYVGCPPNQPQK